MFSLKRCAAVLALLIVTASPVFAQNVDVEQVAPNSNYQAFNQRCSDLVTGKLVINQVEKAKCQNMTLYKNATIHHYAFMDLINVINAKRIVLAEKVDNKQLSEAEASLEYSEFVSDINEKAAKRSAQMAGMNNATSEQKMYSHANATVKCSIFGMDFKCVRQ